LPPSTRWLSGGIAAVVLALVVAWVLFVPVADWLAHHDVGSVKGALHETALDNARGRLLTLGAGLFAAGALLFTARNFTVSRRTLELTEQGQVTDRYTKAIDQLGSDRLEVRIGGIYALERIANDSSRDHHTVVEVLAAFIRERSREFWPLAGPDDEDADLVRLTRPDVQAAVTVLGRQDRKHDRRPIDLSGANLSRADLGGVVPRAVFWAGAVLGADFSAANLRNVDLSGGNLAQATLVGADFTGACLGGADLTGAVLDRAILTSACLTGAVLTSTRFARADLTDAIWPEDERVPEGWERDANSGRLLRAGAASAPAEAAQAPNGDAQNGGSSE